MSTSLRDEICQIGASLYARGYVHGTAGNISVRTDTGFLITPTDASLGRLDPDALAELDRSGVQINGAPASKTMVLHRRIYGADPEARCIIHTHSTNLVALSLAGAWKQGEQQNDFLPPITPYFVMKVGHVPLIPYRRPGDPAVGDDVAHQISMMQARGVPIRAVMLDRLGPNVWHRSPSQACGVLEELEETARLWQMTRSASPAPLTEAQIEELRVHFGAHW